MRYQHSTVTGLLLGALSLTSACAVKEPPPEGGGAPGTAEDRAQLFDEIRDKTARREAFSPVKNERLGFDPLAAMDALASEVTDARTDVDLFYALMKASAARRDRHLAVYPAEGGLVVPRFDEDLEVPLRFAADYGTPGAYGMFVAAVDQAWFTGAERTPSTGDRVLSVNGQPLADHVAEVGTYYRWSTVENLWWNVADELHERNGLLPPDLFGDEVTYELQGADGATYTLTLPYLPEDQIDLHGWSDPVYPDMELAFTTETYALYRHTGGRQVVLLRWFGFKDKLVEDVDRLVAYAAEQGLLQHALVIDGTGSRGGSRGVYALQRMTGQAFTSTFGNLRLSDIVPAFVEEIRGEVETSGVLDGDSPEGDDGGRRLLDWLEGPVMDAWRAGEPYSDNVPFKLAYLPPDSDGVLEPAPVHFEGPLVAFFGPGGGSHLDQFLAMIEDNDLGYTIGMPTGGYSNTWEWTEVLTMPGTGRPLVEFMWSIGQTIRPNGEVLEGNPADVDERVPQTAENFDRYHALLLERAYAYLDALTLRSRRR